MIQERDSQRARVYRWEKEVFWPLDGIAACSLPHPSAAGPSSENPQWGTPEHPPAALHKYASKYRRERYSTALGYMTLAECEKLARRAIARSGETPRRKELLRRKAQMVYFSDGRGTTIARGGGYRINLPRWARRPSVVLHEAAHVICNQGAPHGPEFVRVYIDLLSWHFKIGIRELRANAKEHRVKVGAYCT